MAKDDDKGRAWSRNSRALSCRGIVPDQSACRYAQGTRERCHVGQVL